MADNSQAYLNEISSMAWTTEMEAQFIELVREKDYLWNIKSNLYSKKALKRSGYEEISHIFWSADGRNTLHYLNLVSFIYHYSVQAYTMLFM